jgi:biopolymer transport protein TolR
MNVVPYIDVMLVLLIIFMVTAPLVTQGVKVELPQATAEPVDSPVEPIIVSVDAAGGFHVDDGSGDDTEVDPATLQARVMALRLNRPEAQVLINGDAQVPYQRVVEAMALLQAAGVPGVGLMTRPADP